VSIDVSIFVCCVSFCGCDAAEIDSLRQVDKEGEAVDSKDRTVRVATLLQQLNFNLNEVSVIFLKGFIREQFASSLCFLVMCLIPSIV
jgi:hypothetical protein